MTIRFVASDPVGAPLAMSTLGAGARSLRAPAMPSIVGRPRTGSKMPGCVTGPATGVGCDHVSPPLNGRGIRRVFLAAEGSKADVDVAEERTRGSVVGPDLLLVGELRSRLARDDHRRHPGALDACRGGCDIVGARDRDRLEALEDLVGAHVAEVRHEIGVIQARSVGPVEVAGGVRFGSKGDCRVAARDQARFEVAWQRADGPDMWRAAGIWANHTE